MAVVSFTFFDRFHTLRCEINLSVQCHVVGIICFLAYKQHIVTSSARSNFINFAYSRMLLYFGETDFWCISIQIAFAFIGGYHVCLSSGRSNLNQL